MELFGVYHIEMWGLIKCQGRREEIVKDDFRVLRLGERKCMDRTQVNLGRLILVVGVVFVVIGHPSGNACLQRR